MTTSLVFDHREQCPAVHVRSGVWGFAAHTIRWPELCLSPSESPRSIRHVGDLLTGFTSNAASMADGVRCEDAQCGWCEKVTSDS